MASSALTEAASESTSETRRVRAGASTGAAGGSTKGSSESDCERAGSLEGPDGAYQDLVTRRTGAAAGRFLGDRQAADVREHGAVCHVHQTIPGERSTAGDRRLAAAQ